MLNQLSPVSAETTDSLPILTVGENKLAAFTAYLEKVHVCNSRNSEWELFSLCDVAARARLVQSFEQLLALEHVRGFTPLPYQIQTAERVLRELRGRAILADEVGLGKTIEAGLIAKEYQLRGLAQKILILVPASLVLQWTRELNEKFGIGCVAQRNEWTYGQHKAIVASIDTAKRDPHKTAILNTQWDLLIVDEAHKLKNSRTRNWQMVNQISTKFMLLLTATPMQNNLQELHTLITLLRPGQLGNTQQFQAQFVASAREAKDASGLRSQVSNVMIRNRRSDGTTALPNRKVSVVHLDLNDDEKRLYENVQGFLRSEYDERKQARTSILPLLTLQREICSSPYAAMVTLEKMYRRPRSDEARAALAGLLEQAGAITTYTKVQTVLHMLQQFDDKCIIFTEYRATQDLLLYTLRKSGIGAVPFRGGFGRGKKDWMKDLFAKKARVLVATESGGEGINLQFCHRMINFDLPWNPMRLEQRIGRIHRLGQASEVEIHNLSTRGTIEAHMVELLQEKIKMFELVIGELDYIVGEKAYRWNFDEQVLEMAMTSQTDDELTTRFQVFGDELIKQVKRGMNS